MLNLGRSVLIICMSFPCINCRQLSPIFFVASSISKKVSFVLLACSRNLWTLWWIGLEGINSCSSNGARTPWFHEWSCQLCVEHRSDFDFEPNFTSDWLFDWISTSSHHIHHQLSNRQVTILFLAAGFEVPLIDLPILLMYVGSNHGCYDSSLDPWIFCCFHSSGLELERWKQT